MALIVDDEQDLTDGCARFLKDIGFKSQLAQSVEKAIPLFNSHNPALVLSDIYFRNGQNGFDLARYVQRRGFRTPVILMSGYEAAEVEEQARRAGAARFLHKPFTRKELISTVLSVLR